MGDALTVACEAATLGRECYKSGKLDTSDVFISSVLVLPHHLRQEVLQPLLHARELPELLDALPAALHCTLLAAAVQCGVERSCGAHSCAVPTGDAAHEEAVGVATGCLQLLPGPYSASAQAALFSQVPTLPPLGTALCTAELPAAELIHALSAHPLTRLDLSGVDTSTTCVGARMLANALPSWPRLRSLRLGKILPNGPRSNWPIEAVSDILAPALASSIALTSLDLCEVCFTPELTIAVAALTRLAQLKLDECEDCLDVFLHLGALPQLRTFSVGGVELTGVERDTNDRYQDLPIDLGMRRGMAACTSLVHLDLKMGNAAYLELAALPRLESLRLGTLRDSSLAQHEDVVPPFVATEPACRCGLRALPHLQQLTALYFDYAGEQIDASVLGVALPLLPLLARLQVYSDLNLSAMAAGWACAPALRALTCFISNDVPLLHDAPATAPRLQALTSLRVVVVDLKEEEDEEEWPFAVQPLVWLSRDIAQLTGLRSLSIWANPDRGDHPLSSLAVLSAFTGLRRFEPENADLTGVEWGTASLRDLTMLRMRNCTANGVMRELADLTNLRCIGLQSCGVEPADVSAFVQQRAHLLPTAQRPQLDLDMGGNECSMDHAALSELLDSAEAIGVRNVVAPSFSGDDTGVLIANFNKRWGRQRKCVQSDEAYWWADDPYVGLWADMSATA